MGEGASKWNAIMINGADEKGVREEEWSNRKHCKGHLMKTWLSHPL